MNNDDIFEKILILFYENTILKSIIKKINLMLQSIHINNINIMIKIYDLIFNEIKEIDILSININNLFVKYNENESLQISLLAHEKSLEYGLNSDISDCAISEDSNINKMINEYKIIDYIGKGASGNVYLAINTKTNIKYAIKIMTNITKTGFSTLNKFNVKKEIAIMKKMHHPNIIKLIDTIFDIENNIMYIVIEYIANGCIFKLKENKTCDIMPQIKIIKYITDIIKGLQYLHTHNIIHRDIKPENILLNTLDHAILVDFGISSTITENKSMYDIKGTSYYIAPEIISGKKASTKSDIWSLGIVIYLMICGKFPFDGKNINDIFKNIENADVNLDNCNEDEKELLTKILCKDPNKRINLNDILKLDYFQTFENNTKTIIDSYENIDITDNGLIYNKNKRTSSDSSCSIISDPFDNITIDDVEDKSITNIINDSSYINKIRRLKMNRKITIDDIDGSIKFMDHL